MAANIDTEFKLKNDSTTEISSNCQEYVGEYPSAYIKEELPFMGDELVRVTTFSRYTQADRIKQCVRTQDQKTVSHNIG